MPPTKQKLKTGSPAVPMVNAPTGEVLTLSETADYLRLQEADVLRLVGEQGLPGRRAGSEWRFLKGAIQAWLSTPSPRRNIWDAAGILKDDPHLEEMLEEIERMRGRPAPAGKVPR
jgi:excisionase family DNA binding protein